MPTLILMNQLELKLRKLGFLGIFINRNLIFWNLNHYFLIFKGRDFPGIKLTDVYDIPFTSVSSFVLLMSSLTMVLAHNALETNDQEKTRVWLLATAMLGAVFLAGQIYEFTEFYHKGFELSTNIFSSTFLCFDWLSWTSCIYWCCFVTSFMGHWTKTKRPVFK